MSHLFDLVDTAPQDAVLGVVGVFLLLIVITDRVLSRRGLKGN